MRAFFAAHDLAVSVLLAAWWLALTLSALPSLRVRLGGIGRAGWAVAALGVAAMLLSLFAFPALSRYEPLGHEASYFECFRGTADPASSAGWDAYVTYPMLRWFYRGLGEVLPTASPAPLLVLNAAARGLACTLSGLLAFVLLGSRRAAVVAAALLALHPLHAAWGASLYNVAIPQALAVLALLQATGSRGAVGGLAAGAAAGLVMSLRVEWITLIPSMLPLLLAQRAARGTLVGIGVGVLPALLVAASGRALTSQGGYHDLASYLGTLSRQWAMFGFYGPALALPALPGLLAGLMTAPRRIGLGLVTFAALQHAAMSTFNDVSDRHMLVGLLGPTLLLAAAADAAGLPWKRARQALASGGLLGAAAGSALGLIRAVPRYYAPQEAFVAAHPLFDREELDASELESGDCYLITDNGRLWDKGLAGSPFNLMDPDEAARRWQDHGGCILWLEDYTQWRVDGLAVAPRGDKLRSWFDWQPQGWARFEDGLMAAVWRMQGPPFGQSAPRPGSPWAGDRKR